MEEGEGKESLSSLSCTLLCLKDLYHGKITAPIFSGVNKRVIIDGIVESYTIVCVCVSQSRLTSQREPMLLPSHMVLTGCWFRPPRLLLRLVDKWKVRQGFSNRLECCFFTKGCKQRAKFAVGRFPFEFHCPSVVLPNADGQTFNRVTATVQATHGGECFLLLSQQSL